MDKKLNALWKEAQYPFDQITYKLDDLIRLDTLHKSLIHIVEFLRNNFPQEKLFLNHDWHEHDGFINLSHEIQWDVIDQSLESAESLYNSRDGDYQVRITIFPESLKFILRYYVLDEDDDDLYPGIWGDFDLTIDKNYADEVNKVTECLGLNGLTTYNPKRYFDENYGG